MSEQLVTHIGKYCRAFRLVHMELTIRDIAATSNYSEKILSHFENGKANNIQHLACYVRACKDEKMLEDFYAGFTKTILKFDRQQSSQPALDLFEDQQIAQARKEWEGMGK